ncbi:MAG: segregation/condensation protein A [Oscillospiraceae bacterium]|nr:segregation/condensation protein A [Oscillospiraceae bacterium]
MENLSFHLEGIVRKKDSQQDFEGPLSLILMLLQKNRIEIRDLQISDILDQYLEYLDRMQSMDLEVASEFVQMASHLLYLKTRTLLAVEEEVSELEQLMESLEQLQARDRFAALTAVIPPLKKASETGLLYFSKLPEPLPRAKQEYAYRHEPVDLLKAMLGVWTRGGAAAVIDEERIYSAMPRRILYSVREKGMEILNRLREGPTSLKGLYARCRSGSELVATFISVLELCRLGSLRMETVEDQIVLQYAGGDGRPEDYLDQIEEGL